MPVNRYMLLVAYDGTRFHGFQRQIDSVTMMVKRANNDIERPKKRPHTHESTGFRKGCNLSVQEVLEMMLLDLFPHVSTVDEICLKFAGRTDKGVHANGQVCVVRLPRDETEREEGKDDSMHCWKLRKDINSRLPVDISIQSVILLNNESAKMGSSRIFSPQFDPRHDAKQKRYSYTIKYRRRHLVVDNHNGDRKHETSSSLPDGDSAAATIPAVLDSPHTIRNAFDPPCLWICPWTLDDTQMKQLCLSLCGTHNYSNFVHKADRFSKDQTLSIDRMQFDVVSTIRESIMVATDSSGSEIKDMTTENVTGKFMFQAVGFRRSMLRNLVGYCVDVCRGWDRVPDIEAVFDATNPDASTRINAAPAVGLCLESVTYD